MSDTDKKNLNKLRIGEIFEYDVSYFDDDEKKEITEKKQAFFIKVENLYYLISKDTESENSLEFFQEISGMIDGKDKNGNDKNRDGKKPFSLLDAINYLKIKDVTSTGKFIIKREKKKQEQF